MTLGKLPCAKLTTYMDWKRGILRVEISDAILIYGTKLTETSLKTARKPIEMLHTAPHNYHYLMKYNPCIV